MKTALVEPRGPRIGESEVMEWHGIPSGLLPCPPLPCRPAVRQKHGAGAIDTLPTHFPA